MKLKDIELKAIKFKKGHEGEQLITCSVTYKNKRVGTYEEADYGGANHLELKEEVKDEVIQKLVEIYNESRINGEKSLVDEQYLAQMGVGEMVIVSEWEKEYKKQIKKHGEEIKYVVCNVYDDNGYARASVAYIVKDQEYQVDEKETQEILKSVEGNVLEAYKKHYGIFVFESLEDFKMNTLQDRLVQKGTF